MYIIINVYFSALVIRCFVVISLDMLGEFRESITSAVTIIVYLSTFVRCGVWGGVVTVLMLGIARDWSGHILWVTQTHRQT